MAGIDGIRSDRLRTHAIGPYMVEGEFGAAAQYGDGRVPAAGVTRCSVTSDVAHTRRFSCAPREPPEPGYAISPNPRDMAQAAVARTSVHAMARVCRSLAE